MKTKEGERIIYKVANQRAQSRQEVGEVSVIKYKDEVLLTDEKKIKERWREYFSNLLNVENEWDPLQDCPPVEGLLPNINEKDIEEAMKKRKSGRATRCSGLPMDLPKHLGKEGNQVVTSLLQKVWDEEKMPAEWELIELVTIYEKKGNPLDCGNFRGIKFLEHVMKILEKLIEGRLRGLVSVNDMEFGFRPR
ncbi:uncharacterized protein LOC125035938 [Penaeus chinensis]|uniref:uncharacterized protein LOC125035938 n=1 Tax=Penaeus chinensis TaxID=139456 RepID=UPI001FB5B4B9|nr:uncharacterized protein LOC125035938 [Penaeus chinensis]